MDHQKYLEATAPSLYPPAYPGIPQQVNQQQPMMMPQPVQIQPQVMMMPQPAMMIPQHVQQQQVMQPVQIMSAPQMVMAAGFSYKSQRMVCPMCQADIATRVKYRVCSTTHMMVAIACAVTCWFGCCCFSCIPYCKFKTKLILARINTTSCFHYYRLQ